MSVSFSRLYSHAGAGNGREKRFSLVTAGDNGGLWERAYRYNLTFVFLLLQGPGEGDKSPNRGEYTVFIQRACRLTESLLDNREWITNSFIERIESFFCKITERFLKVLSSGN